MTMNFKFTNLNSGTSPAEQKEFDVLSEEEEEKLLDNQTTGEKK